MESGIDVCLEEEGVSKKNGAASRAVNLGSRDTKLSIISLSKDGTAVAIISTFPHDVKDEASRNTICGVSIRISLRKDKVDSNICTEVFKLRYRPVKCQSD